MRVNTRVFMHLCGTHITGNRTISTSFGVLLTCSDGDDRNKLIDMITQTVTSVCDVAAISVGGRPRTARGPP